MILLIIPPTRLRGGGGGWEGIFAAALDYIPISSPRNINDWFGFPCWGHWGVKESLFPRQVCKAMVAKGYQEVLDAIVEERLWKREDSINDFIDISN